MNVTITTLRREKIEAVERLEKEIEYKEQKIKNLEKQVSKNAHDLKEFRTKYETLHQEKLLTEQRIEHIKNVFR